MYLITFWVLAKEISKQNVESVSGCLSLCVIKIGKDTKELKRELLSLKEEFIVGGAWLENKIVSLVQL